MRNMIMSRREFSTISNLVSLSFAVAVSVAGVTRAAPIGRLKIDANGSSNLLFPSDLLTSSSNTIHWCTIAVEWGLFAPGLLSFRRHFEKHKASFVEGKSRSKSVPLWRDEKYFFQFWILVVVVAFNKKIGVHSEEIVKSLKLLPHPTFCCCFCVW